MRRERGGGRKGGGGEEALPHGMGQSYCTPAVEFTCLLGAPALEI